MKFYAIAAIKSGETIVGARLLDLEGLATYNWTNAQIEGTIQQGNKIRNLSVEKGKLKWEQGAVTRYATLNASNPADVTNANSIVVLGQCKNSPTDIEYVVANYKGNVVTIPESKLVEYGKEYTLANCKVNTKDKSSYVSSISGELETLNGKTEFLYDVDSKTIVASLPFNGATKLIIPSTIKGNELIGPEDLLIRPMGMASKITHLVLPASIKTLKPGVFSSLNNLRVVECNASLDYLYSNVFDNNSRLTDIYLKTVKNNTYYLFKGLSYLKNLKFGIKPTVFSSEAFKGCVSLNINDVLYEGLDIIGEGVFDGCIQVTEVNLPSSLKKINSAAFNRCKNIKSLRINNSTLDIELHKHYNNKAKAYETTKLLSDSPGAVIYCPYAFPMSKLKECVAEHVKIVRDEPTHDDNNIANKQLKAKILGIPIRKFDVAKDASEAIGVLSLISDEKWRECLLDCVKTSMLNKSYSDQNFTVGDKGAFLNICIANNRWHMAKIKQAKVGNNYMYTISKSRVEVKLIGRALLKQYVAEKLSNNGMNVNKSIVSSNGTNVENVFTLTIPARSHDVNTSTISSIYEKDDALVIQLKNGDKTEVKFTR